MRRGVYYSLNRLLYPLSAVMIVFALVLLPSQSAYAITSDINKIEVITEAQEIAPNKPSGPVTVQFLNANGQPEPVGPLEAMLTMSSSSSTGAFFSEAFGAAAIPPKGMQLENGATEYNVFYQDATAGSHTLTFTLTKLLPSEQVDVSHQIVVKDPVVIEPVAPSGVINPYNEPHTTTEPIVVNGTIENVTDAQAVRLSLRNDSDIEVAGIQAAAVSGELGRIPLPQDIADGSYQVKLMLADGNTLAQMGLAIQIPRQIPDVTPPIEQKPVPSLTPAVVLDALTLEPVEPLSPTLSTQFSRPVVLSGARSQNFVANASQGSAPAQAFIEDQPAEEPLDTEQSISLDVGEEEPILEPSKEGWKILGAPWYLWGGGAAIAYGAWFGIRRLINPAE